MLHTVLRLFFELGWAMDIMLKMIYDNNGDDDDVAKRTWEERPKLFITGFEPWAML